MSNIETDNYQELASDDDIFRRRWWLLTEAARAAPLREALEIASAAEAFLAGETIKPAPRQSAASAEDADHSSEIIRLAAEASADTPRYLH